jgi:hypothetical protein
LSTTSSSLGARQQLLYMSSDGNGSKHELLTFNWMLVLLSQIS